MPGIRLEEFIERYLDWEPGDDPVKRYNIKSNCTRRKYGNSGFYRDVAEAVHEMLDMNADEQLKWFEAFTAPLNEEIMK